jgi:hypothetical protein
MYVIKRTYSHSASQLSNVQGDGFDLYIDGARYLPDNVSLSLVTAYVASADMVMYGKLDKDVDPRSKSVWSPLYLARKEFR